ncbi:MAG TPA: class II fructose-1,6-bisphosphate aldolase [Syntrophothermus lipocalidus]|uniref:Fructose-1,6-bisphosphate aldolase, class II n=1 Tax=Syntrophothermus lipocalidus (strain DSM 12680 / TGB-C1) TaxID=643648 RepID=D7CK65_SYNLT|nr:class II fructose-1,6-bisphosphate aldolase [Syntrophothermus lipocalidus]ADI03049.1 fructose-1,6-bisphosphate aldolase, class II [Syntrophothermus lipocalidus DSM 12680]HHV76257.1 class II fructose-1,6-bisphosphate aldolase [Syntrophothermus lipocalidus]HOV42460.1 class II fructose-1,6-bisphosphate aldolase [Syntrophothermus lipocalidus]
MALVPVADLLVQAEKGGYAVGAFNANNMEIVQAIMEAARLEKAPVIMQASQGAIQYAGLDFITGMVKIAAGDEDIPVALHLDHGTSFEQVIRCIRGGFTSVMYDGSKLPLEENIAITKKVIEIARAVGVSVEAELGKIGGTEDNVSVDEREAMFTDPEEARYFVEQTGVDSLAVAIGTAHGQYKGEPRLDFDRLAKIRQLTNIPIVLHGSSGVPDDQIRKAISLGVRKVNIDTNIREAFVGKMREELAKNEREIDPRKILGPAREAAVEIIREKIRLFGSAGRI